MINKLTGQPLSEEAVNVLNRLSNNETVDLEEIQNLKEIKEAYSCLSSATSTIKLKDREGIQRGVFEKLQKMGSAAIDEQGNVSYNGVVRKESRIDIVIGLPASGKSSTLVNPLSQEFKSRIIDSDEAKKLLPEFNNGWGAGTVHEESKLIVKNQMSIALRSKENIVWPVVGSKLEKLEHEIKKIKKINGYNIYIHFCELLPNRAIGRMMLRFFEEGRFLDPKLCCQYGSIGDNYEAIKQRGDLVDGYSKWNNDVAKGEAAKLIEATERSLPANFYDNTRDGGSMRREGDGAAGRRGQGSRGVLQAFEGVGRYSLRGAVDSYESSKTGCLLENNYDYGIDGGTLRRDIPRKNVGTDDLESGGDLAAQIIALIAEEERESSEKEFRNKSLRADMDAELKMKEFSIRNNQEKDKHLKRNGKDER